MPGESPAYHVKHLRFSVRGHNGVPEAFFEHIPWFTNVEGVTFSEYTRDEPLWIPSFWGLPQSVTSLTINGDRVFLRQVQDIMAHLPNLDNLFLSGSLVVTDEGASPGIETALRGRFGGKLRLIGGNVDGDVVDMLLEVPTGLHFTEVRIYTTHECLFSTVRLAEACSETLVKLMYMIDFYRKYHPFSQA